MYDPRPYTVTENKGTMVTASRTNAIHVLTRNTSFFKPLKVPQVKPTADKYDIEVDEMDGNILENNNVHPDYIRRENGDNKNQHNEENLDDKLRNAEEEQGNDCDQRRQVADENMHEEDLDIGEGGRAVMGGHGWRSW